MIDILTKPADQLDINDLQALIDSRVQEDERIEFKRDLSAKKGQKDSWYDNQKLADKARNVILEKSVAFANAFGGALILGIEENNSRNGPGVANEISPIPHCADLANRLKSVFGNCVEPHIPGLEIIPIITQDDAGAIVIRVSRSRLAPHRVIPTRVCSIRRSDRCEPMTMREIQDLVLNLARGTEQLDTLLTERSERFEEEFPELEWHEGAIGIRATAAPVGNEIWFDYSHKALKDDLSWHSVLAHSGDDFCELEGGDSKIPAYANDWRPILRGARMGGYYRNSIGRYYRNSIEILYREIHCKGLVELGLISSRSPNLFFTHEKEHDRVKKGGILPAEWLITIFANLLVWIDRLRNHAGAPIAEYALELETRIYGDPLPRLTVPEKMENFRTQRGYQYTREMRAGFDNDYALGTPMDSTQFPRYSFGSSDEIVRILNSFELDLWNNVGLRDQGHDGLTIKDFGQS